MDVAHETDGALVLSTMVEAQSSKGNNADHVVERLRDWQRRVSTLYRFVENTLGHKFRYDMTEKQRNTEEQVQRANLSESQIPSLDILRILDLNDRTRALIIPRGLWIIGANGRLDLRVHNLHANRQKQYYLIDNSIPLSGAERASWFIVDPLDRLEQTPLTEHVLRELIPA